MDISLRNPLVVRDRARHAAPQVFEYLRDKIIALELPPGTVLNRAELQAQLELSSTPIRDALLRLQEEGLVDIYPQHATVVSPIDLDLARQAQFLRRSIELEVVSTVSELGDQALIRRLRAIVAQQQVLAKAGELSDFNTLDQTFHQTMYEAAEVPALWALVRRHSGQIDRIRRLHLPVPGKMAQIVDDHTAIVEAISAGQAEMAQRALRDHLSRSLAFSTQMRLQYPDYFRG